MRLPVSHPICMPTTTITTIRSIEGGVDEIGDEKKALIVRRYVDEENKEEGMLVWKRNPLHNVYYK